MKWFGKAFDAPVYDPKDRVDTPVGETCMICQLSIAPNDHGFVVPYIAELPGILDPVGFASPYGSFVLRGVVVDFHRDRGNGPRWVVRIGEGENTERWSMPFEQLVALPAAKPAHRYCFLSELVPFYEEKKT